MLSGKGRSTLQEQINEVDYALKIGDESEKGARISNFGAQYLYFKKGIVIQTFIMDLSYQI